MSRFVLKPFSAGTDSEGRITTGQFGSFVEQGGVAGSSGTLTTDPNALQGLQSWTTGWTAATEEASMLPRIREMNGVQYVFSKFAIQNHMDGITYWQAGMGVTANQTVVQYEGKLYLNITGTNTNNAPDVDTTNWSYVLDLTKEYVDTTSAQNVSNNKTIISNVRTAGGGFLTKNNAFDSTSTQTGDQLFNISMFDKDNISRANITAGMTAADVISLVFGLRDSAGTVKTSLSLRYNSTSDSAYMLGTTPALTATGNEVITASWFNQKSAIPKLNLGATVQKPGTTWRVGANEYGVVTVHLVAPSYGSGADASISGNTSPGNMFAACSAEGSGAGSIIVKPNDYIVFRFTDGGYCNQCRFIPFL